MNVVVFACVFTSEHLHTEFTQQPSDIFNVVLSLLFSAMD